MTNPKGKKNIFASGYFLSILSFAIFHFEENRIEIHFIQLLIEFKGLSYKGKKGKSKSI